MAYEFKKLSEVEAIEALSDTANVLVEDGGVIKRVPMSNTASEYDAVIDLGVYTDMVSLSDLTGWSVPAGIVALITEKVNAGTMPKILGKIAYSYYDVLHYGVFEFTAFGTYGGNQVKGYCDMQAYSGHYSLVVYLRCDEVSGYVDDIYTVTKL